MTMLFFLRSFAGYPVDDVVDAPNVVGQPKPKKKKKKVRKKRAKIVEGVKPAIEDLSLLKQQLWEDAKKRYSEEKESVIKFRKKIAIDMMALYRFMFDDE